MSKMDYANDADRFNNRIKAIRVAWAEADVLKKDHPFFLGTKEREDLVGGIIRASCINIINHREPFSFIDDSIHEKEAQSVYNYLIDNDYVRRDVRKAKDVVFPTEKLVSGIEEFLKIEIGFDT